MSFDGESFRVETECRAMEGVDSVVRELGLTFAHDGVNAQVRRWLTVAWIAGAEYGFTQGANLATEEAGQVIQRMLKGAMEEGK